MGLMGMRQAIAGKGKGSRRLRGAGPPEARQMSRRHALALLVVSGLGEALSLYLTYVHYRLHREPGWESACAISERINCDSAVLSPYGSIVGMPLSLLGVWFYLLTAAAATIEVRGNPWRFPRSPALVLVAAGAVGTGASLALAFVSATSIGSLCPVCAGLYAVNIAILVIGWLGVRTTQETVSRALTAERAHWERHSFRGVLAIAGALAVFLLLRAGYIGGTAGGSEICGAVAAFLQGGSSRPLEVKVYSDFQCPHCKVLDRDLRRLRNQPRLRLLHAHYPIDGACNPRVTRTRHPGACMQAVAALCAQAQGRGAEYSDWLFDGEATTYSELTEVARTLGLDAGRFEGCLKSDDTRASLREGIDEAIAAGVRATPTLFVNGKKHTGGLDTDDLRCLQAASDSTGINVTKGAAP